jgi:hypothetical protein
MRLSPAGSRSSPSYEALARQKAWYGVRVLVGPFEAHRGCCSSSRVHPVTVDDRFRVCGMVLLDGSDTFGRSASTRDPPQPGDTRGTPNPLFPSGVSVVLHRAERVARQPFLEVRLVQGRRPAGEGAPCDGRDVAAQRRLPRLRYPALLIRPKGSLCVDRSHRTTAGSAHRPTGAPTPGMARRARLALRAELLHVVMLPNFEQARHNRVSPSKGDWTLTPPVEP